MNKRPITLLLTALLSIALAGCTSFRELTTTGLVEDKPGVRTKGVIVEDDNIESKLNINLKRHPGFSQQANIQAKSFNQVVLLTGQVPDQANKDLATAVAQQVRNVRSVHNEIQIREPLTFMNNRHDNLIATKVRARLLATEEIESSRIEMVVENSNVFFMGLVTRAESDHVVNAARQVAGIRKIVKVFEYID